MPRKNLIKTNEVPYHIFNRTNNKEFFKTHLSTCWDVFTKYLTYANYLYGLEIHSFVLMSNHYHLIATTPESNIGEITKYFQREISKEINQLSNSCNHVFGGRYHWSLIKDPKHYALATKYIFRNPCKAGITDNVLKYKYSSLCFQAGLYQPFNLKIFKPSNAIDSYIEDPIFEDTLNWFNEPFKKEFEVAIEKGLRRTEFKIPLNKNSSKYKLEEYLMHLNAKR